MNQNIDFLQVFPQKPVILETRWIILVCFATSALVILISLSLAGRYFYDHGLLLEARLQESKAITFLRKAESAYPLLSGDTPIGDQVAALQKILDEKKKYFEAITHEKLSHGFSEYLAALARITPNGLWLTNININQSKNHASIEGYVITPPSVSLLLTQLNKAKVFSEMDFEFLVIKKILNKTYDRFSISNYAQKDESELKRV